MDAVVADLMKGPKTEAIADQIAWFKKLHDRCAKSPEAMVQRIAPPLKDAIDLLTKVSKSKKDQESRETQLKLTGYVLTAQGLGLYSYLEGLNEIRNQVAAAAAKQKDGSDAKKKALATQAMTEQLIDGLAKVYQSLREAKFDQLDQAAKLVFDAQKVAESLKASL
ncbi:MAG: hypothetical protein K1X89_16205 [Myxococcaceae bacterium]|nr:hypothetical protein [Myxococcaceae bacterium]